MPNNEKSIAFLARTEEERLLLSRVGDLCEKAGYDTAATDFYNLGEQYLIRAYLSQCGLRENENWLFWGGYPHAERQILMLFPEYLTDVARMDTETPMRESLLSAALSEDGITALSVCGSGYRVLSHRDYLGSLLALGVERSVIGDIAVTDDRSAVVFVRGAISEYLSANLERIGNDKVHIRILSKEDAVNTPDCRRYETLSDTVASLRLDGIVAAACNLPREKAKQLVSSDMVEVDFRPANAPDTELVPGQILSVRGHGRFIFDATDGASKKGRIRIRLRKLI
ncbi:MAG: hypothetical protein IJ449_08335 [Clostridia bacterium]|nr:hypothetical protein [Clostridia bacterium]